MSFSGLSSCQALQDCCVAKEGVIGRVRKHNTNLMNEQGQCKEVVRTLNKEVKEVKGKLKEADRQKNKLQEEVTVLREKVETVGTEGGCSL